MWGARGPSYGSTSSTIPRDVAAAVVNRAPVERPWFVDATFGPHRQRCICDACWRRKVPVGCRSRADVDRIVRYMEANPTSTSFPEWGRERLLACGMRVARQATPQTSSAVAAVPPEGGTPDQVGCEARPTAAVKSVSANTASFDLEAAMGMWEASDVGQPTIASLTPRGFGRLRARGRTTRMAEQVMRCLDPLAELMKAGGETSPLLVGPWFRHVYGARVRPVGIRSINDRLHVERVDQSVQADGDDWPQEPPVPSGPGPKADHDGYQGDALVAVIVESQAEILHVSLRLLVRCVNYMAYRPRNAGTALLLRTKCSQFAKEMNMSPEALSVVIHGTIVSAMVIPEVETRAWRTMSGGMGDLVVAWGERLRAGLLRERSWWWRIAGTFSSGLSRVGLGMTAVISAWLYVPWLTIGNALLQGAGSLLDTVLDFVGFWPHIPGAEFLVGLLHWASYHLGVLLAAFPTWILWACMVSMIPPLVLLLWWYLRREPRLALPPV